MAIPRLQFVSLYGPAHRRRDRVVMTGLLTGLAALVLVGALVTARRLLGHALAPLPISLLASTAVGAFALVELGRRVWRQLWPTAHTPRQRRMDQAFGWTGSAAFLLLAVGCIYPGYGTAEWVIWLPLAITEQFRRQSFFDRGGDSPKESQLVFAESDPTVVASIDRGEIDAAPSDDALAGDVLQQLFRVRGPDGVETVYGSVAADFVPGQRHAVLHVGFCPPLERTPDIEVEPCAGPDAGVKVLQTFTHGVRLEVRLAEPARQPCRVTVDLAATPSEAPTHVSA